MLNTSLVLSFFTEEHKQPLGSACQNTWRLPGCHGRKGVWGAGGHGKHHTVSAPHWGGITGTVLLLCLPKGGRGRAGWEAVRILESLPVAAFPAFICGKVMQSLGLEPRPAHLPPPPNLCTKSGLLLTQWPYPSKASHSNGRAWGDTQLCLQLQSCSFQGIIAVRPRACSYYRLASHSSFC